MREIATPNAPAAVGPYSQAYEHNGMLFASGQIPVDPKTGAFPEGIRAQAKQSCENVKAILRQRDTVLNTSLKRPASCLRSVILRNSTRCMRSISPQSRRAAA